MRHELLDGVQVVTPAPALFHQAMVRELMALQPDVFVVERQPGVTHSA